MDVGWILPEWVRLAVPFYLAKNLWDMNPWFEPAGYDSPLHQAAGAGSIGDALALIAGGAKVNEADALGRSPLHAAVSGGVIDVVQALIDAGARLEDRDNHGQTPLFWAAYMGRTKSLQVLTRAGAQIEARNEVDFTPLMAAAVSRELWGSEQPEHCKALIDAGADARASDKRRTTGMHLAASRARPLVMEVLHDTSADFDVPNSGGFTPRHFGAECGHDTVIGLLANWGADANAKSGNGLTPIHMTSNSVSAIRALARAGADIDIGDQSGCTALLRAAAGRQPRTGL